MKETACIVPVRPPAHQLPAPPQMCTPIQCSVTNPPCSHPSPTNRVASAEEGGSRPRLASVPGRSGGAMQVLGGGAARCARAGGSRSLLKLVCADAGARPPSNSGAHQPAARVEAWRARAWHGDEATSNRPTGEGGTVHAPPKVTHGGGPVLPGVEA